MRILGNFEGGKALLALSDYLGIYRNTLGSIGIIGTFEGGKAL